VPEEIYSNPVNAYVADFIGDITLIPARADGAVAVMIDGGGRVPISRVAPSDQFQIAVRPEHVRLAPAGMPGIDATVEEAINEGSTTLLLLLRVGEKIMLKARFIGQIKPSPVRGAQLSVTIDPDVVALPHEAV
jgi:ABC-type Fe3+/spermidine/putrescine transport system ATPase subunit